MLKRHHVVAARDAVVHLWGTPALDDVVARIPEAERAILCGALPAWVPVRVPVQIALAVWEGPVARDKTRFFAYLHRQTDMTTGRIRKALLSLAKPERVFASAPAIWRSEHTAGVLEARTEGKSGVVVLRDHPYVESPQGRAAIAETFRYIVELCRAKGATETHALTGPRTVEIKLRWT
jgi:hypothetical protein